MSFTDWVFAAIVSATIVYLARVIWRAPDAETMNKVRNMDLREDELHRREEVLRQVEINLAARKNALSVELEKARKSYAESMEIRRQARLEVERYEAIARKARQELAGARQRFKRKLNK